MSQTLTFYTNPMSRGRIVRWLLEELGIEYTTQVLDYATTMKDPAYLAINPMGKVPAIKHGDIVVTETAAICAYLADAFPEAQLAPINNAERAAYYRWLFFAAGPVEQAIGLKMIGTEITPELKKSLGCGNLQDTFNALIDAISKTQYVAGDRFTAADVYIGKHIEFGIKFGMLDPHPAFASYLERVANRPAKLRADAIDDKLLQA